MRGFGHGRDHPDDGDLDLTAAKSYRELQREGLIETVRVKVWL